MEATAATNTTKAPIYSWREEDNAEHDDFKKYSRNMKSIGLLSTHTKRPVCFLLPINRSTSGGRLLFHIVKHKKPSELRAACSRSIKHHMKITEWDLHKASDEKFIFPRIPTEGASDMNSCCRTNRKQE